MMSLSELQFRCRRFILLVQTKKVISVCYGSNTSSWKSQRWAKPDLILMMIDGICITSNLNPLAKFSWQWSKQIFFGDTIIWNGHWLFCSLFLKKILSLIESLRVKQKLLPIPHNNTIPVIYKRLMLSELKW